MVKRIALLVPHTDSTLETDLKHFLPPNFVVHTARLWLDEVGADAEKRMVDQALPEGIKTLQGITRFDAAVFGCTSASAVYGAQGLERINTLLADAFHCPAITAFGAVLNDLRALGEPVALLTPYTEAVNRFMIASLAQFDIEVAFSAGLGIRADPKIAQVTPAEIEQFVLLHRDEILQSSNTVLLSCTNLRAFDAFEEIVRQIGIDVITSNRSIINWLNTQIKGGCLCQSNTH
ncbi:MAG: aspartate/glutamate racemase family protein [Candidatus Fimivivens sp.]